MSLLLPFLFLFGISQVLVGHALPQGCLEQQCKLCSCILVGTCLPSCCPFGLSPGWTHRMSPLLAAPWCPSALWRMFPPKAAHLPVAPAHCRGCWCSLGALWLCCPGHSLPNPAPAQSPHSWAVLEGGSRG